MSLGNRFFDGNPVRTLVWLVVVSVLVGFVFVTLGIDPIRLVEGIVGNIDVLIATFVDLGHWIARHVGRYFLVGVVVVVPLWLIARLFAMRKGGR
jgi:hypothetical protein